MTFSERRGLVSIRDTVQKENIDTALRNGLWNAFQITILDKNEYQYRDYTLRSSNLYGLFFAYWLDHFKMPIDEMPNSYDRVVSELRTHFFRTAWNGVYDFTEFTAQSAPEQLRFDYIEWCNRSLENEQSAYRFLGCQITEITSETEIDSIECSVKESAQFNGVNTHLKSAISFLSNRESPDYRNSVKESISAVESLCKAISNDKGATLHSALKQVEEMTKIHPAFKKALSSLYGFTNDGEGIRHSLLEESNITYSDAKFMLVSCSAFVSYILGKYAENQTEVVN